MLDTRGYACPTPVMMVKDALDKDPAALEVLADSRVAVENISRLARSRGYQMAEASEGQDVRLTLTK